MRTIENITTISLSKLNMEEMKKGKAEAQEIAQATGKQWMEVYYERNLADPLRHYEPSIPKAITLHEFNQALDGIDGKFREMLAGL